MRLLISMVNRSRRELNYRAGIVPSGFRCQQQPWRGHAAPQDRRSSTEPAASAASACATCRACGQRDPGWGSATSCRASACKHENPKHGRLQVLHAKKTSVASSSLHRSLWRCYCSPPIGTGPLVLALYVSTPVSSAASEAQIMAFTKAESAVAAGGAGTYPRGCHNLGQGFQGGQEML